MDPDLTPRRQTRTVFFILGLVGFVLLVGAVARYAYERYGERYTVERADNGAAVTRVVAAAFSNASQLKVGELTGTVQASASDTRAWGLLTSDQVVKAPFSADYFVDVSRLGPGDYRWEPATRTLTVHVPDVLVGRVNVDEAGKYLTRTRGVIVTRSAMEALQQHVSAAATRTAQAEANRPERVAAARANARRALGRLAAGPLEAAGLGPVTVDVRFAGEGDGREQMERSRSLQEVLGNAR
jgi:hypothetical protein